MNKPWLMTQTWNDLLFAHWPVDKQVVREQDMVCWAPERVG